MWEYERLKSKQTKSIYNTFGVPSQFDDGLLTQKKKIKVRSYWVSDIS